MRELITARTGMVLGADREPRLTILPREGGAFTLVYTARVATPEDVTLYFIDARTGAIVDQRSDAKRQVSSVGVGIGVLGERKKVSSSSQGGTFVGSDRLRPPMIETYDMRGNLARLLNILNGFTIPGASDFASDSDNDWTDGANVDAHVYAGYTYDYYFKRFGRRGLDNANIRMRSFTHPVNRDDARTASIGVLGTFYLNAFYAGDGIMVYGEGLPPNLTFGGQRWNYLAGSLDVVAHELTHGVTDYSSELIYANESGALNEAFSDIMGVSAVFFFQQAGSGAGTADYIIGNDVDHPGRHPIARGSVSRMGIPTTTEFASPAPKTTAACTSIPASPAMRSTWPSRAAPTARPVSRFRGWAPPTASRWKRCSTGPSRSCCPPMPGSPRPARRPCRRRRTSIRETTRSPTL